MLLLSPIVDTTPLDTYAFLAVCVRLWDFPAHQKRVQGLDFFLACCSDQVSRKHVPRHIVVELCNVFIIDRIIIVFREVRSDGIHLHSAVKWPLRPET